MRVMITITLYYVYYIIMLCDPKDALSVPKKTYINTIWIRRKKTLHLHRW